MTKEELTRLKEICEKATPGPWYVQLKKDPMINSFWSSELPEGSNEIWTDQSISVLGETVAATSPCGLTNAQFIAEAREAMPKLIAEVERLHDELSVAEALKEISEKNHDYETLRRDRIEQENTRLREALEKIALLKSTIDSVLAPNIAREALGGGG